MFRRIGKGPPSSACSQTDEADSLPPGERVRVRGNSTLNCVDTAVPDTRSAKLQPALGVPICDAVVANLFLHHFSAPQLAGLLAGAARRAKVFIALEPRRSVWALAVSRMLWVIGCNGVTRHDAPVSVRAGFAGGELSRLWPAAEGWSLVERRAGWFSHLFVAQRVE